MKKMKKMLVVVLIAAITMLSSCIKEEVSSEVTALRNAQLGMITAKTEHQNLLNAQLTIENELATALSAHEVAMNALELQEETADMEFLLAEIALQLVRSEERLQEAEYDLQEAINDLAEYLATQGLEEAADYLDSYEDNMGDYYDALYDILNQEGFIAGLNALFAQEDYVLLGEIIQRGLDSDIAILVIMEDILTTLEAVAADPTTIEAEITAALVYMQELENEHAELTAEKDKHEIEVVAPAWDAWKEAAGGTSWFGNVTFDGIVPTYLDAADEIIEKTEDIADYTEDIADEVADNVALAAKVVNIEAILTANTANYDAKKLLSDATEADLATAEAISKTAYFAMEVAATDNQISVDALAAANTAKGITEDDLDDAQDDVTDAISDLAAAELAEEIAEDALEDAEAYKVDNKPAIDAQIVIDQAAVVAAQATLTAAQAAYAADPSGANLAAMRAAEAALENAEEDLADSQADLAQLDIDIADAAAVLLDAVDATAEANTALTAANDAETVAQAADDAAAAVVLTETNNLAAADAILQPFVDAFWDTYDDWVIADEANDAAQNITGDAEGLVDGTQDWLDNTNDDIEDNLDDIEDLNNDIDVAQVLLDIATATVADLQTAFDAVDLVALEAAYDAVSLINDDMQDAIDANEDIWEAQSDLMDILDNHYSSIDLIIVDFQEEIDDLKEAINDAEKALADNVIDENEATAIIAAETVKLEELVNLRDGFLAIADEYWALYLAAIGG